MMKLSPELKKVVDCITYKDFERACTVSDGRILSMVRSITDPVKKTGRIAALAIYSRINHYINSDETNDITYAFDKNLILSKVKDKLNTREEEIRQRFWDKYQFYTNYYDDRKDLSYKDLEFPDWDESILGNYDITISSLEDLSMDQLILENSDFANFISDRGNHNGYYFLGPREDPEIKFKRLYEHYKINFYDDKEKYLKFRELTLEFQDKAIFSYLDKEKLSNDEYKNHFLCMINKVHNFDNDRNYLSPTPIGKAFDYYHSNFINWIKKTYNINLSENKSGYNHTSEYPFLDDDSALTALQLRGVGPFEKLLKVTRTGISFTKIGLFKYWYDCTKDIANSLKVDCKLSLLIPGGDYRNK